MQLTRELSQMITLVPAHILFIDRAYSVYENSRRVRAIAVVIRRNNDNKFLISIGNCIIAELLPDVPK
jgi:hypothetical protein